MEIDEELAVRRGEGAQRQLEEACLLEGQDGFGHLPARRIGLGDRLGFGTECRCARAITVSSAADKGCRIASTAKCKCPAASRRTKAAVPRRRSGQRRRTAAPADRRARPTAAAPKAPPPGTLASRRRSAGASPKRATSNGQPPVSRMMRAAWPHPKCAAISASPNTRSLAPKIDGAAIGQRPRQTGQIGLAALGDDDAAVSGGEALGQRLGRAGRRDVPHHALACGRRVWRGRAEMHRRADAPGDLAQQRRLAHACRRLQDDDLLGAAEDAIDQASRGRWRQRDGASAQA